MAQPMKKMMSVSRFWLLAVVVPVLVVAFQLGRSGQDNSRANHVQPDTFATEPAIAHEAPSEMPYRVQEDTVIFSDQEWKRRVTELQYEITRLRGTERAYTGQYLGNKETGVYRCVVCGQPLYSSETKYDSGTGWPSFWKPIGEDVVARRTDNRMGMVRSELICSMCGAHLGHVFNDGPPPTGKRHCINSAALYFDGSVNPGDVKAEVAAASR